MKDDHTGLSAIVLILLVSLSTRNIIPQEVCTIDRTELPISFLLIYSFYCHFNLVNYLVLHNLVSHHEETSIK